MRENEVYTDRLQSEESGAFKPLSVWAKEGWDPEVVRTNCRMEMHPQFGEVYQVVVKTESKSQVAEMIRSQMLQGVKKPGRAAGSASSGSRQALAAAPVAARRAAKRKLSAELERPGIRKGAGGSVAEVLPAQMHASRYTDFRFRSRQMSPV